jgi:hypothetical protein
MILSDLFSFFSCDENISPQHRKIREKALEKVFQLQSFQKMVCAVSHHLNLHFALTPNSKN